MPRTIFIRSRYTSQKAKNLNRRNKAAINYDPILLKWILSVKDIIWINICSIIYIVRRKLWTTLDVLLFAIFIEFFTCDISFESTFHVE